MDRRESVLAALLLGVTGAPWRANAQPGGRTWRVGTVHGVSALVARPYVNAFLAGMNGHGYIVGQNLVFDQRYADGDPARHAALVDEVVAARPDVLIGANTAVALRMHAVTKSIPIVLATSGDPVGDGLVQHLGRPGGNVTGVSLQLSELGGKHVELVRDLLPGSRSVALLADPSATPASRSQVETYERLARAAASARSLSIQTFHLDDQGNVDAAFGRIAARRPDALVAFLSPRLNSLRRDVIRHAAILRIPSVAHQEGFAQDGGLMSYGPSFVEAWRRVSYFVDRILKGAKPADIPVEQPTKFELTLNLKTARALGITVPQSILIRAERVIE